MRGLPPPLVLAYHGAADVPLRDDPLRLFVRPRDLRAQIAKLRSWGYRFATFGELARRAAEGTAEGWAALTFDDGFADNLEMLSPLLRETDSTATVFVVSSLLGRPHPDAPRARLLTRDELVELAATGVEIGAHTVTHARLDVLPREDALRELAGSKADLEAVIQRPVEVAAYPFGAASDETAAAARDAGFAAACMTGGQGAWDDPFRLPRQAMGNRDTLFGLRLKRHGRYEQIVRPVRPFLRTRAGAYAVSAYRAARKVAE